MFKHGWFVPFAAAVVFMFMVAGCGEDSAQVYDLAAIKFETTSVPAGGAGQLYNAVIQFTTSGGAAPPNRFEIDVGVLPPGVTLSRDREDNDFDGLPDEGGAYTGHARLLGYPREAGTYSFVLKAISTGELSGLAQNGDLPALAASGEFTITVGEGAVTILSPTATEGTTDPAVPAFPEVVDFVNPANPQAFFAYSFLIAGGSNANKNVVYVPRELELSAFDTAVVSLLQPGNHDTDESQFGASDKMDADSGDGGVFNLQAGTNKVQVGGFQSPRGRVYDPSNPDEGGINQHGDLWDDADPPNPLPPQPGYDPDWFQRDPGFVHWSVNNHESYTVPARNSRRDINDSLGLAGGDTTLGTPQPVQFSDYFATVTVTKNDDGEDIPPFEHPIYEGTHPGFVDPAFGPQLKRRKYPFTSDQYFNAFFVPFVDGVDLTPLKYRLIVEAIDTRGTVTPVDDVIARKAFIAQIKIPDIRIDTVQLAPGQAGVDYTEFVNASGGVPPLVYELELVDGNGDGAATRNHPLTKDLFGIELDPETGQFFGVPRASSGLAPGVDLTVRVYAAVMNPVQSNVNPPAPVPTGGVGEFDGTLFPTAQGWKPGRHKTLTTYFAPPSTPVVANDSLAGGIDGGAYPGDRMSGAGGVPLLAPYPVGFQGTYPTGTAQHAYRWDASYILDVSYPVDQNDPRQPGDTASGLPTDLTLVGDASLATNGQISGITYDRGSHPVAFDGLDFYVGDGTAPSATAYQRPFSKVLNLNVSRDAVVYMRGVPDAEGGTPSGLLNGAAAMSEAKMAPLMLAAGLYRSVSGPERFAPSSMPAEIDFLPVLLAHGGSDAHVDKSIPSISGFWPAESNLNDRWEYYSYGSVSPYLGWKHLQQELTWIQTPAPEQYRVFLWAETKTKTLEGSLTYQVTDRATGKRRGVLILNPLTNRFWVPAILTNSNPAHGQQFGTEDVWACSANGINDSTYSNTYAYYYGYVYGGSYNKYYSYNQYDNGGREARLAGGGTFIVPYGNYQQATPLGRTSTSVAVSADGLWSATALPGGTGPKILLWRNDKTPIPAAFASQNHITMLNGLEDTGATLTNSACIVNVSTYGNDQRYLLPDSLMFVRGGLLFLMEKRLHYLHGVSLVNGSLSTRSVNSRTALSSTQGVAPSTVLATAAKGQPIPDQDWVQGLKRCGPSMCQFSFAGNQPGDGELGPAKVAFIAGALFNIDPMMDAYAVKNNQSYASYYSLTDDVPRKGYGQGITGNKSVLFLEIPDGQETTGLDLASSGTTIKDLSGNDKRIYGDFLTPGRLGEELDFVAVSPDGKYVAAVRNVDPTDPYTYYYYSYNQTFASLSTTTNTSTSYYQSSDDILLFATENTDLDTGASGTQTVLFLGKGTMGYSYYGYDSGANNVAYASAQRYLDAYARRICGVQFTPDSKSLIFVYQGHNSYNPKYMGSAYGMTINATSRYTGTYHEAAARMAARFNFRTSTDGPINFSVGNSGANGFLTNMLQNLSGVGSVGDTSVPFASPAGGIQQFFATFRSANGNFLYYISDGTNTGTSGRNHMVGFNISTSTINGHAPFAPFSTHGSSIGFEQFDCHAWNYEGRFAAAPGGVVNPSSGRDGAGIVFVIGSDASAGSISATDLEVYAFDANIGGTLVALTSSVTNGKVNAINHLYVSTDGNYLAGQRAKTDKDSGDARDMLNGDSDLFVVTNVHAALGGATPNAVIVSEGMSHGASVFFQGENTSTGPEGIIYSSAPSGGNQTWDDRTLKMAFFAGVLAGSEPLVLDDTPSHYVVLAGSKKFDDNPDTAD